MTITVQVVWLISLYQRRISPYKGYRCAHRVLHGGESCSQFVKRVVTERGPWSAIRFARLRFAECRAARASRAASANLNRRANGDSSARKTRWWHYLDCCAAPDCDPGCCDVAGVDCCP